MGFWKQSRVKLCWLEIWTLDLLSSILQFSPLRHLSSKLLSLLSLVYYICWSPKPLLYMFCNFVFDCVAALYICLLGNKLALHLNQFPFITRRIVLPKLFLCCFTQPWGNRVLILVIYNLWKYITKKYFSFVQLASLNGWIIQISSWFELFLWHKFQNLFYPGHDLVMASLRNSVSFHLYMNLNHGNILNSWSTKYVFKKMKGEPENLNKTRTSKNPYVTWAYDKLVDTRK